MSSIRILTNVQPDAGDWRSDEPIWADDRVEARPASSPLTAILIGAFALAAFVLMATITLV